MGAELTSAGQPHLAESGPTAFEGKWAEAAIRRAVDHVFRWGWPDVLIACPEADLASAEVRHIRHASNAGGPETADHFKATNQRSSHPPLRVGML